MTELRLIRQAKRRLATLRHAGQVSGNVVRFDPADIDIWLADHRIEPIA